jgi:hypothetical protein
MNWWTNARRTTPFPSRPTVACATAAERIGNPPWVLQGSRQSHGCWKPMAAEVSLLQNPWGRYRGKIMPEAELRW